MVDVTELRYRSFQIIAAFWSLSGTSLSLGNLTDLPIAYVDGLVAATVSP